MWIKHPQTGVIVQVVAPEHIQRLLADGGVQVDDPTVPADLEQPREQASNVHPMEQRRPAAHKKEAST